MGKYIGCETLITTCSNCKKDENILVVTDETSYEIGMAFWQTLKEMGFEKRALVLMPDNKMHGEEPNEIVAAAMLKADVMFRATTLSLSHTDAKKLACANGTRDLNCADYNMRMLTENGGLFTDFIKNREVVDRVAKALKGKTITVTSPGGTNFTASIEGCESWPQYGMSTEIGQTSSPPDIEANIYIKRFTGNGVLCIDASMPHPDLGVVTDEGGVMIEIKDSLATKISGGEQAEKLRNLLAGYHDGRVYEIGEIGIGLNPDGILSGRMLEDEGTFRTVHMALGCGSSKSIDKSSNTCPFHLDMLMHRPTIAVDGRIIIKDGDVVC